MASENPELDEINNLLEVERQAAALIEQAMTEADKTMSEARGQFNEQFKAKSEKITEELTQDFNQKLEQLKLNHKEEIENFQSALEKTELNQAGLNKLLDKLLFPSV